MRLRRSDLSKIINEELELELICRSVLEEAEEFKPPVKAKSQQSETYARGAMRAIVTGYKEANAGQDFSKMGKAFKLFLKKQGFANPCDYVKDPKIRLQLDKESGQLVVQTNNLKALMDNLEGEMVTMDEVIENMEASATLFKGLSLVSALGFAISKPAGKYDLIAGDGIFASIQKALTPDAMHKLEIPNITGVDADMWMYFGAMMASLYVLNATYRFLLKTKIPCTVAKIFGAITPVIKGASRVAFSVVKNFAKYTYRWLKFNLRKRKKFIDPKKLKGTPTQTTTLKEMEEFSQQLARIFLISEQCKAVLGS